VGLELCIVFEVVEDYLMSEPNSRMAVEEERMWQGRLYARGHTALAHRPGTYLWLPGRAVVAGYVNPRRLYIELNYTLTDGQPSGLDSTRSPSRPSDDSLS